MARRGPLHFTHPNSLSEQTYDHGEPGHNQQDGGSIRELPLPTAVTHPSGASPATPTLRRPRGRPKKAIARRAGAKKSATRSSGVASETTLVVPARNGQETKHGITVETERKLAAYIAFRTQDPDISNKDMAAKLGMNASALHQMLYRAGKRGLVNFDEPLDKLRYEALPLVAENLIDLLKEKDKTTTIEVFKGTLARQYQAEVGATENQITMLGIKIEPAERTEWHGTIVGVGRGVRESEEN